MVIKLGYYLHYLGYNKYMLGLWDGIFIWFFMWALFWGVFEYVLLKRGVNYVNNYLITSWYFFLSATLIVVIFQDYFIPIIRDFEFVPFLALFSVFLFHTLIYYFFKKYFTLSDKLIRRYLKVQFLLMDYRYIVARSFNILFQQVLIVLLAWILVVGGLDMNGIIFAFIIIFVVAHIPVIGVMGMKFGSYFIVASVFAAWIFSLLVVKVNYGFVYSFALHQLFYALSSASFWLYLGHKKTTKNIFKE